MRPRSKRPVTKIPKKLRRIDYDKLASESGEEAYRSAKEAGLPEDIALNLRKVFGAPLEPEFRAT